MYISQLEPSLEDDTEENDLLSYHS